VFKHAIPHKIYKIKSFTCRVNVINDSMNVKMDMRKTKMEIYGSSGLWMKRNG
jgi:hypothetical protein